MSYHFRFPGATIERLKLVKFVLFKFETLPVDVAITGHPADGSFAAGGPAVNAINDPFQDAHILAKAWPNELAIGIFTEPVDVEDPRSETERSLHPEPVPEIIAHVIPAKRQHGHRIAADLTDRACRCRRGL